MRHKLRLLNLVLIIILIFSFTGCAIHKLPNSAAETTASQAVENGEYNIGDTGPAGGLIFYDKGNNNDGWRYLEAAPSDLLGDNNNPYTPWYNGTNIKTGATATAIGTGKANTQKIVDIQGNGSYAAKLCSDLTQGGGYSDWFLPSSYELNLMYTNLCLKGIGSFGPGYYWSSSEFDADHAWIQNFGSGYQGYYDVVKVDALRVRAVRAF
jgi:hypothetical protein